MESSGQNDKNAVLIRLASSEWTSFAKQDFDAQSPHQKTFSAVWALEAEVNNGGFSQYFFNSSAETASFVAEALVSIGAGQTAEICRRAIATAFPKGLPTTRAISEEAADFSEEILDQLDELDTAFFAYPHDLTELLFNYVRAHPEDFGLVNEPR